MASKSTYECFTCKNNGFPGVQVYLAGKDAMGRAIRLEDNGTTLHQHKTKLPSQQQVQQTHHQQIPHTEAVATTTNLLLQMKLLHQKMDRIIKLLEPQNQSQG